MILWILMDVLVIASLHTLVFHVIFPLTAYFDVLNNKVELMKNLKKIYRLAYEKKNSEFLKKFEQRNQNNGVKDDADQKDNEYLLQVAEHEGDDTSNLGDECKSYDEADQLELK